MKPVFKGSPGHDGKNEFSLTNELHSLHEKFSRQALINGCGEPRAC